MVKSRLTLTQKEEICLDVEAGSKCASIGRKFGISSVYVGYIYHKVRGISIRYYRELQSIINEFHAKIEPLDDLLMIIIE